VADIIAGEGGVTLVSRSGKKAKAKVDLDWLRGGA
jgi:hypothetical protein